MPFENDRIECLVIPESRKTKIRVECEKALPDFCEDVSRIIKADCFPRVTNRSVLADAQGISVRMDGECVFSVLYVSGGKSDDTKLAVCTFTKEFSQKLDFGTGRAFDETRLWADVELRCEDSVCRPLGPRKLQLRSELSLCAGVKCNAIYEKCEPGDGELELKKEEFETAVLKVSCEKEFTASVETELPEGLADMGVVASCDVGLFAAEPVLAGGTLDFTALAVFSCTYLPEDDTLAPVSVTQPLETACSVENADFTGEGVPLISLSVSDVRAEIEETAAGENRKLVLGVTFLASAAQIDNVSSQFISDCYSPHSLAETKKTVLESTSLAGAFRADQTCAFDFECADLVSVESPAASFCVTDCFIEGKNVRAKGVFNLCALGVGAGSQVKKLEFERESELTLRWDAAPDRNAPSGKLSIELNAAVKDLDLAIDGAVLKCEAKIGAEVFLFANRADECVTAATLTAPREKDADRVVFYYPEEGEDFWSVGKKFGLTQESLREQKASGEKRFLKFTL